MKSVWRMLKGKRAGISAKMEEDDLALARKLQEEEEQRDKEMKEAARAEGIDVDEVATPPSHWYQPGKGPPQPRRRAAHAPPAGMEAPPPSAPPADRMYPTVRGAAHVPYRPAVVQDTSRDEELARQMALEEQLREERMREAATVSCPICMEKVPMDDARTLRCDHRACVDCLSQYISMKINSREVRESQLVCPHATCNLPLAVMEVKGNTSEELYEKYQRFAMETLLEGDPNSVMCPHCQVYGEYHGLEERPKVKCINCKKNFCARCREPSHHEGTCADFLKWKRENGMVEEALEKLITEKKWQRCPRCNLPCSLEAGCFFMTCKCGTHFCYLCGDTLTREEHFKGHFLKGAFSAPCVTMEKRAKEEKDGPPAGGPRPGAGAAAGAGAGAP